MRLLITVNVGSSSVRLDAFDLDAFALNVPGRPRLARHKYDRSTDEQPANVLSRFVAEGGLSGPAAVAHRVFHGGRSMTHTQIVKDIVKDMVAMEHLGKLAPLHNPMALTWLRAARSVFGTQTPQIAVFDTAFFAYHGYPWLIHRLTYSRTNHQNLHVRGFKEEGSTTTPFDMVVRNDLDRFHLVMDVVDRVPAVGPHGPHVRQAMRDRLVDHKAYIARHGQDMPEVRDWAWPHGAIPAAEEEPQP